MASSDQIIDLEKTTKAIISTDTALTNLSKTYMTLVKGISDVTAAVKEQEVTANNLTKAQKATQEQAKQLDAANKALAQSEAKLNSFDAQVYEQIQKNNKALADKKKAINDSIKAQDAEAGSLIRMRQELAQLTKAYDQTGTRTKAAADEIKNLSEKIENAEKSTNRHQRGVGSYKESISEAGKELFGFAGIATLATVALDKLKDAFASTEMGARFFKRLDEASTTYFQNLIEGTDLATSGVNALVASQIATRLDQLRIEERSEKEKVAQTDTEVKLLKLKASATKDLTEQNKLYHEADAKENESIKIRRDHLTEEIALLTQLSVIRPTDTKLLDELSQKKVEIITIEGDKSLRVQMKIGSLKEKLEQEEEKAAADREKRKMNAIETSNSKMLEMINQEHMDGASSNEQYNQELLNQEIVFLRDKQKLYKSGTKEYEAIQVEIQNILIKANDEKEKLTKESAEKELKIQKELSKEIQGLMDDQFSAQEKIDNDEIESSIKKNDQILDEHKKLKDQILDEEKKKAEAIRDIQFQMASEAVNGIFDLGSSKRDEELSALDKKKQKELSNDKLTKAQKLKIEEDYDKKVAAIKTKQAKADKLQAMFNIALSTFRGTMEAAAMPPLFAANPIIPWLIALGALQLGLAAAQPIPKFAKGGTAEKGRGIFGEAGRELMFLRSGETLLADKATYFDGNKFKGANIKSNAVTEQILAGSEVGGRQMTDDRLLNEMKSVKNAILSKPVAIYDKDYRQIGQAYSQHQKIYLDKLTRMN